MSIDIALACEDPGDCVNGPEPHEFLPSADDDMANGVDLPCFRQSWERTP